MNITFKNVLSLLIILSLVGCVGNSTKPNQNDSRIQSLKNVEKKLLGYYSLWEGTPYRLGGVSKKGIDCSAFVRQAYASVFDVEVPRTTFGQAKIGKEVKKSELVPGDLVLFKTSRSVRHVGVVVHGNKFMHVSVKKGVIVSSLDNIYWRKKYWKAVRPDNGLVITS